MTKRLTNIHAQICLENEYYDRYVQKRKENCADSDFTDIKLVHNLIF
jgi:hypothetical protein